MTEEFTDSGSLDSLFEALEQKTGGPQARNPFKFLDPYGPGESDIFFGRDFECAELYSRFYKSRLLLVYGESGTGKTSLVQCGLRAQIPSEEATFVTVRTAVDPLQSLRRELESLVGNQALAGIDGYAEMLGEAAFQKAKTIVLVFDQFEELFILQPPHVRQSLADEIRTWLSGELDVRVIIGLREEYLAKLGELEANLPGLLENRFWVRRMSQAQAREAIVGPCDACGVGVDEGLADELLSQLDQGEHGIELPMLQVMLDSLYRRAARDNPEAPVIGWEAYREMGQAHTILGRFVEERVAEYPDQERVRQVLKGMVTADGTKRVSAIEDLADNAARFGPTVEGEELAGIMGRLVDDRIVREDADNHLFELRHDALAETVYEWLSGLERELMKVTSALKNRHREYVAREQAAGALLDSGFLDYLAPYKPRLRLDDDLQQFVAESERKQTELAGRRRRAWGAAIAIAFVVLICLTLVAVVKWQDAEEAKQRAENEATRAAAATKVAEEQRDRAKAARELEAEALRKESEARKKEHAARRQAEESKRQALEEKRRAEEARAEARRAQNMAERKTEEALLAKAVAEFAEQQAEARRADLAVATEKLRASQRKTESMWNTLKDIQQVQSRNLSIVAVFAHEKGLWDEYLDFTEKNGFLLSAAVGGATVTESMNAAELFYWGRIMAFMRPGQIRRYFGILLEEKRDLAKLELKRQGDKTDPRGAATGTADDELLDKPIWRELALRRMEGELSAASKAHAVTEAISVALRPPALGRNTQAALEELWRLLPLEGAAEELETALADNPEAYGLQLLLGLHYLISEQHAAAQPHLLSVYKAGSSYESDLPPKLLNLKSSALRVVPSLALEWNWRALVELAENPIEVAAEALEFFEDGSYGFWKIRRVFASHFANVLSRLYLEQDNLAEASDHKLVETLRLLDVAEHLAPRWKQKLAKASQEMFVMLLASGKLGRLVWEAERALEAAPDDLVSEQFLLIGFAADGRTHQDWKEEVKNPDPGPGISRLRHIADEWFAAGSVEAATALIANLVAVQEKGAGKEGMWTEKEIPYSTLGWRQLLSGDLEAAAAAARKTIDLHGADSWFVFSEFVDPMLESTDLRAQFLSNVAHFPEHLSPDSPTDRLVLLSFWRTIAYRADNLEEWGIAVAASESRLELMEPLLENDPKWRSEFASTQGALSWYHLFTAEPDKAVEASRKGLEIDPNQLWIETNLAHGLLMSGKTDEAMEVYLRNVGKKVNDSEVWEQTITADFRILRGAGIAMPKMEQVQAKLLEKSVLQAEDL